MKKSKKIRDEEVFLDNLLTPREKKVIARRLAVIALLKEGKSYKEISRALWVSPNTIRSLKESLGGGQKYKSSWARSRSNSSKQNSNTMGDAWLDAFFSYVGKFSLSSKAGEGRH